MKSLNEYLTCSSCSKHLIHNGENKRVIYIIRHVGNAILIIYMRTFAYEIIMIYTTFKHFSLDNIFFQN